MARKSKSLLDSQRIWEEKISRAKQVKTYWKELFKVQQAIDYLDGKQKPPGYDAAEWITVNHVYSHLKAQLPALYGMDPYFYVKIARSYAPDRALIEEYERRGKVRASNLNYYKRELELKPKARLAIQDAMFSFGVIRVEHASQLIENPDAGKPVLREKEENEDEPEEMVGEDGLPIVEPEVIPVNSRYAIERVHPDDFLFDEDAGPLPSSWSWIAERMRVQITDIEKNPSFKKSAVKALRGKSAKESDSEEQDREKRKKGDIKDNRGSGWFGESDKEKVIPEVASLWKIWDLKNKKWLIIAENGEEPLIPESDLPKGVEDHPYAVLRFTLRDDSPYPIPPMSQGLDPAREYNISRSDILKHRKRFNRKYEVYTPALDDAESEIGKLERGDDGTCIKKAQPVSVVTPIADAPLDQMRWTELGYLKAEMIELFGGATGEARGIAEADSATQAGILENRMQLKEGDALSEVVDWIQKIAQKLDQLVQAHIDIVQAVRVTGIDGVEYMAMIRPEDYGEINGQYIYEVNVGSTQPRLPQMERASLLAALQLFANAPHLMLSRRMVKRVLELHHIEDETMVDELVNMGRQMMQQAQGPPPQTGSLPGVGESRPVSAMGGQFGGAAAPQIPT